jgi:hypothetical protein
MCRSAAPLRRRSGRRHLQISWRLLPLLGVLWVLAWLDRVNIGFAKLQMLDDLKFSEAVYAWAPASSSSATSCSKCRPTCCCRR